MRLELLRSWLYVPADNDRFIRSANGRDADAIILDLEDSVHPDRKRLARESLAASVPLVGQGGARVYVRINGAGEAGAADAREAVRAGAHGVLLPKLEQPAQLDAVCAAAPDPAFAVVGILETPAAVLSAQTLAQHPRLSALICGGEDLTASMGARPTPDVLRLPKLLVHLAAKAAGKRSYGMLRSIADYADGPGIEAAAREASEHGFDGCTCVHPSAVARINAAFAIDPATRERLVRMVNAASDALAEGRGAFSFEGEMVDAPIVARARKRLGLGS